MEFEFDRLVEASAVDVWDALTETATMESHLPGTTRVTSTGPEKLRVTMKISMGFLRPTVNVDVRLLNVSPKDTFSFKFEGKALGAGVDGEASVALNPGGNPEGGPVPSTRVSIKGSVRTSGLLRNVSDSKIDAAVTGFLGEYFASVERANPAV